VTKREGRIWNNLTDEFQSAKNFKHLVPEADEVLRDMSEQGLIERTLINLHWHFRLPQPISDSADLYS